MEVDQSAILVMRDQSLTWQSSLYELHLLDRRVDQHPGRRLRLGGETGHAAPVRHFILTKVVPCYCIKVSELFCDVILLTDTQTVYFLMSSCSLSVYQ